LGSRLRWRASPARTTKKAGGGVIGLYETSTPDETLRARLLSKVRIDRAGCWVWIAGLSGTGYPYLKVGGHYGRVIGAHRLAFTLFSGPIPLGFEVDHLCRRRACICPDHLEAVTKAENIRREIAWLREHRWAAA
jgi:hypothetical protein